MQKYLYEDLYNIEEKHWWHISKRRIVQSLIRKYRSSKNLKILDIGCGAGKNLEELKVFGTTYGLDSSKEAIKYCHKRGLKNLVLGKAEKVSLPSNSFDAITILDVLEHTDDQETLKEMNRLMKEDSLLIITVPALPWLWSDWDKVLHHKRRYTLGGLKSVLESNGFHVIKIFYLYSFLVIPAFIVRKIKQKLFNKKYPSDFELSNPIFNFLLNQLARFEFILAQKEFIPFGTTLMAIAKK